MHTCNNGFSNPISLNFLGKSIIQHGIKALFGERSSVRTLPLYVYLSNLLSPCVSSKMEATCEGGCWRA